MQRWSRLCFVTSSCVATLALAASYVACLDAGHCGLALPFVSDLGLFAPERRLFSAGLLVAVTLFALASLLTAAARARGAPARRQLAAGLAFLCSVAAALSIGGLARLSWLENPRLHFLLVAAAAAASCLWLALEAVIGAHRDVRLRHAAASLVLLLCAGGIAALGSHAAAAAEIDWPGYIAAVAQDPRALATTDLGLAWRSAALLEWIAIGAFLLALARRGRETGR